MSATQENQPVIFVSAKIFMGDDDISCIPNAKFGPFETEQAGQDFIAEHIRPLLNSPYCDATVETLYEPSQAGVLAAFELEPSDLNDAGSWA